jgi:hypothetical protein
MDMLHKFDLLSVNQPAANEYNNCPIKLRINKKDYGDNISSRTARESSDRI